MIGDALRKYLRDQWPGEGKARREWTGLVEGTLVLVPVELLPVCSCGRVLYPNPSQVACECGKVWVVEVEATRCVGVELEGGR